MLVRELMLIGIAYFPIREKLNFTWSNLKDHFFKTGDFCLGITALNYFSTFQHLVI